MGLSIAASHRQSEVLHKQEQYNRYPKRYGEVNNFVNRHAFTPNAYSTHPSNLLGKTSATRTTGCGFIIFIFVEDRLWKK
jgi:hypothetical protein